MLVVSGTHDAYARGVPPRDATNPAEIEGPRLHASQFNGFKRHIAADVDRGLILACALTPANRPEEEAVPALQIDLARQTVTVDQLVIDRGVHQQHAGGQACAQARVPPGIISDMY